MFLRNNEKQLERKTSAESAATGQLQRHWKKIRDAERRAENEKGEGGGRLFYTGLEGPRREEGQGSRCFDSLPFLLRGNRREGARSPSPGYQSISCRTAPTTPLVGPGYPAGIRNPWNGLSDLNCRALRVSHSGYYIRTIPLCVWTASWRTFKGYIR